MIGDRVFLNIAPEAIDRHGAGLVGELQRVAINALKKGAAHAEGDVADAEPIGFDAFENRRNAGGIHAVALQDTHMSQGSIALAVDIVSEALRQQCKGFCNDFDRISAVWPYHERRAAIDDSLA